GAGKIKLVVMDISLAKVAEPDRADFLTGLTNGFRQSGAEAMTRKGFKLDDFKVEDVPSQWPHSIRATSRFTKDDTVQINVTYFFPAERLYMIGYEGAVDAEPEWFVAARKSFEAR